MILPFVWPWGLSAPSPGSSPGVATPTLQRATPGEGGSVTVNQTDSVVTVLIEGQQPIATLDIILPQPGSSRAGQIVRIVSWIDIGSVDYGDANVNGALSQFYAGEGIAIQNIEDNEWLNLP